MICLYERAGAVAQIQTSYDHDQAENTSPVHRPVHGTRVERFAHKQAYHRRLIALEADLERDAWHMTRPPQFVPEVFPRSRDRKMT